MRYEYLSVGHLSVDKISGAGPLPFMGMGVGNIYYVCETANTPVYEELAARYDGLLYDDGSEVLHTGIAAALSATVECRNDYVVCQPKHADIDITAALVMDKKNVHLICPAGMGYDMGANNSLRIEQTTDSLAVIAVSDAAVEIAGFYFKPDPTTSGPMITLAATSYAPNIHHNYFTLKGSVTHGAGILGSGDAGAWGNIERNHFQTQVSDSTFGSIIYIGASATGACVNHNQFTIGLDATATVCILNGAVIGNTNFNIFGTCGGSGVVSNGGQIGNCVSIHASGNAIGNRGAVGTGEFATGGTADHSFCDNKDGLAGGAAWVEA